MPNSVIYDGDCGFCQSTVNIIKALDWFSQLQFEPFQKEGLLIRLNELTKEKCEKEIYLVKEKEGVYRYYAGYDAFKMMSVYIPITFLISPIFFLPGVSHLGKIIYRVVAKNRHKIKIGNISCKMNNENN